MKKLLPNTLLLFVASMLTLSTATAQTMPPVQSAVYVSPANPSSGDSVKVIFTYISGDSCPDFYLAMDSVVANKIYVSKKSIDNTRVICAQIVTKFTTTLNLGILHENTQIYFEGALMNTIQFPCTMDKFGVVVDCSGQLFIQETTIYLSAIPRLYVIQNNFVPNSSGTAQSGLKAGDNVKFGGYLTNYDSTNTSPCHPIGIATCYEVTTPPPACVKDKKGVVVNCAGLLYIQEYSTVNSYPQLYTIKSGDINTTAILSINLKVGDNVIFGGYPVKIDSTMTSKCRTVGVATCYEVTTPPPACVMDKKGVVVNCTGLLYIQEYSPVNSYPQLYTIKSGDAAGILSINLKVGDKVIFGGYPVKIDSTMTNLCRTVGIATCYEVISTPPSCVMDKIGVVTEIDNNSSLLKENLTGDIYIIKDVTLAIGTQLKFKGIKIECIMTPCYNMVECYQVISTPTCVMDKTGVIVEGVDGCTGQLFIQDTSTPNNSIQLYAFRNSVIGNDTVQKGLKAGTHVKFGGYLIKNDSNIIRLCNVAGIANCYEVIPTPPDCVMDKPGVVVTGVEGCIGQLFIEETTPYMSAIRRLYVITNPAGLKAGDQVKFGGYLTVNDSVKTNTCHTIGVATCYEVVGNSAVYSLLGSVFAGNDLMKSGLAILYKKGGLKATASYTITDGTYSFTNLSTAQYTVYVIPAITVYKNYLPTFYINEFLYDNADYLNLNSDITGVVVNLKQFDFPIGTGKISGNIFFETYNLKDSALINNGIIKTGSVAINNSAINIPVILLNSAGIPVAWTMTDSYGNYIFENIALNTYRIVAQTASAIGESLINLTPGNSTANADLMLKSSQNDTGIPKVDDSILGLYPNPMTDNLIITLKGSCKIDFYNSIGQLMMHQILNAGINTVDVSILNKGVYVAKMGQTTLKVIKK